MAESFREFADHATVLNRMSIIYLMPGCHGDFDPLTGVEVCRVELLADFIAIRRRQLGLTATMNSVPLRLIRPQLMNTPYRTSVRH